MTVPIVENWSDVKAEIVDSYPSATADGFVTVELKVTDVKDVSRFKNLLADRVGDVIQVNVPESALEGKDIKPGAKTTMRVRMASPKKLFVHPEHLRIQ